MKKTNPKQLIEKSIQESIATKNQLLANSNLIEQIAYVSEILISMFRGGGKLLLCGNGGSAADAQHIAAEFSGRFYYDRKPLPAEALHVNTSYLTAVANDYSFADVYARMVEGCGQKGDVLWGFSTSGNSENIIRAFEKARLLGITTIGFTGFTGGKIKDISDVLIAVPSIDTPRIQASHILISHCICEIVEAELFPLSD